MISAILRIQALEAVMKNGNGKYWALADAMDMSADCRSLLSKEDLMVAILTASIISQTKNAAAAHGGDSGNNGNSNRGGQGGGRGRGGHRGGGGGRGRGGNNNNRGGGGGPGGPGGNYSSAPPSAKATAELSSPAPLFGGTGVSIASIPTSSPSFSLPLPPQDAAFSFGPASHQPGQLCHILPQPFVCIFLHCCQRPSQQPSHLFPPASAMLAYPLLRQPLLLCSPGLHSICRERRALPSSTRVHFTAQAILCRAFLTADQQQVATHAPAATPFVSIQASGLDQASGLVGSSSYMPQQTLAVRLTAASFHCRKRLARLTCSAFSLHSSPLATPRLMACSGRPRSWPSSRRRPSRGSMLRGSSTSS